MKMAGDGYRCVLFVCLWCLQTAAGEVQLGSFHVHNSLQCQKLCWYTESCDAYKFMDQVQIGSNEVNCRLLTNPLDADEHGSADGWQTERATNDNIFNTCSQRPCTDVEICVPAGSSVSDHQCVPASPHCGDPVAPSLGVFRFTSTSVGQVAILNCFEGYVLTPANASPHVTCLASSHWSALNASCELQLRFESPSVPFLSQLPSSFATGWEVCVKGIFTGDEQMKFDFLSDPDDSTNVVLQIAFRGTAGPAPQASALFSKRTNGYWQTMSALPNMTLTSGNSFSLILSLDDRFLTARLNSADFPFPWEGQVDLLSSTHLRIDQQIQLQAVNLGSAEECHGTTKK